MRDLNRELTGFALRVIEEAVAAGELRSDVPPPMVRDVIYGGIEHLAWTAVIGQRRPRRRAHRRRPHRADPARHRRAAERGGAGRGRAPRGAGRPPRAMLAPDGGLVRGEALARGLHARREAWSRPARTITEADIHAFAALSGDWHPLHTDVLYAAASPFGERIAHGMLVLSWAARSPSGSVPTSTCRAPSSPSTAWSACASRTP